MHQPPSKLKKTLRQQCIVGKDFEMMDSAQQEPIRFRYRPSISSIIVTGNSLGIRCYRPETGSYVGQIGDATGSCVIVSAYGDSKNAVFQGGNGNLGIHIHDPFSSPHGDSPILTTLTGHQSDVSCLVSVDSSLLVSGSRDTTVRLWRMDDGESFLHKLTFEGHSDWIWGLESIPDRNWIASASNDLTIRIWDFEKEQPVPDFGVLVFDAGCRQIAHANSEGGRFLVSCQMNNKVKLSSLTNFRTVRTISTEASNFSIHHSSDFPHFLFVGDHEGAISCWDLRKCRRYVKKERIHSSTVRSITSIGRRQFASCGHLDNDAVRTWNANLKTWVVPLPMKTGKMMNSLCCLNPLGASVFSLPSIEADGQMMVSLDFSEVPQRGSESGKDFADSRDHARAPSSRSVQVGDAGPGTSRSAPSGDARTIVQQMREEDLPRQRQLRELEFEEHRMMKEQELSNLRRHAEQAEVEQKATFEEERLKEQKRRRVSDQLEKQRLNQQYAKQSGIRHVPSGMQSSPFIVIFDFVVGLRETRRTNLTYSFYIHGRRVGVSRRVPTTPVDDEGRAVFARCRDLPRAKKIAGLKLVVEVSVVGEYGDQVSYAWSVVQVFDSSRRLCRGRWRIPTFCPMVFPEAEVCTIAHQRPLVRKCEIFVRVCHPRDFLQLQKEPIDPDLTLRRYKVPAGYTIESSEKHFDSREDPHEAAHEATSQMSDPLLQDHRVADVELLTFDGTSALSQQQPPPSASPVSFALLQTKSFEEGVGERLKLFEDRLETVEEKVGTIVSVVQEMKKCLSDLRTHIIGYQELSDPDESVHGPEMADS